MAKILIVEDEKTLLDTLQKTLSKEYTIIVAANGTEGLRLALEEKPDLILLDILLPFLTGFEVLEKLRADPWGKDAAVIILTNLADVDTELKAKSFNVKNIFIKANISIKNLLREIKQTLV